MVDGHADGPRPALADSAPALLQNNRRELRGVLGFFATGITVMTAGRKQPKGMTANSFTSVSLAPPLVLEEKAFAISVLSAAQEPLARRFADRGRPRGAREFEAVESEPGRHTGAPLVSGALAWLECALEAVHDGGDHSILPGAVLDAGRGPDSDALLFHGGKFHRLAPSTV
ncbi:flavin reductase family protein [Streptomyces lydicus]|uniref:flavin reductase family protein n=1 Tax=Streptomyces lydicus TaxID=47763 RepID=UPI003799C61D